MENPVKQKIVVTAAIYFSFFASGINFNILSPTLKRLAILFEVDSFQIARIYTMRSSGYLIGTLLGSVLFQSKSRQVTLGQLYTLVATTLALAPLTGNFVAASTLLTINGIATGVCDVKTNVLLCQVWSDKSQNGAYIQAMYFSFACGCVVAPLLAGPFITGGNIQWLFIVASVIIILSAISLLVSSRVYKYEANDTSNGQREEGTASPSRDAGVRSFMGHSYRKLMEWMKIGQNQRISLTIIFISLMIMAYSGTEIIYWEFLPTYLGQLPMNISEAEASYMASAIKSGLMVSRGVGILAAALISAQIILTFDLMILSIACLSLMYLKQSMVIIWLGNLAISSAFATIYPQIYSLVVSKFQLNDVIGAIFCFSSSITAVILPEIVAHGLSEDSNFLILLVFVCTLLTALFFLCATFLMRRINRRVERQSATEAICLESSRL